VEIRLHDAVEFFDKQLRAHQARGKPLEAAIDAAFVELARWSADLAEVHLQRGEQRVVT
jgi:hypothetical protein